MKISLTFLISLLVLAGCSSMNKKSSHQPMGAYNATQNTSGYADSTRSEGLGQRPQYDGVAYNQSQSSNTQNRANAIKGQKQTYYFDYDNSQVNPQDLSAIERQARYLAQNPRAKVVLAGNTDERGTREYNIALGERRAKRVAEILQLNGVRPNQIQVVSYGKEKPVAMGHNAAAWRLNRRVNLIYKDLG